MNPTPRTDHLQEHREKATGEVQDRRRRLIAAIMSSYYGLTRAQLAEIAMLDISKKGSGDDRTLYRDMKAIGGLLKIAKVGQDNATERAKYILAERKHLIEEEVDHG